MSKLVGLSHMFIDGNNKFTFQYEYVGELEDQRHYREQLMKWCKDSFVGQWKLRPFIGRGGEVFQTFDQLTIDDKSDLTIFALKWL